MFRLLFSIISLKCTVNVDSILSAEYVSLLQKPQQCSQNEGGQTETCLKGKVNSQL